MLQRKAVPRNCWNRTESSHIWLPCRKKAASGRSEHLNILGAICILWVAPNLHSCPQFLSEFIFSHTVSIYFLCIIHIMSETNCFSENIPMISNNNTWIYKSATDHWDQCLWLCDVYTSDTIGILRHISAESQLLLLFFILKEIKKQISHLHKRHHDD